MKGFYWLVGEGADPPRPALRSGHSSRGDLLQAGRFEVLEVGELGNTVGEKSPLENAL